MDNTDIIKMYLLKAEYERDFLSKKEEINYLKEHFKFRGVNADHPQILRFESVKQIYFDLRTATLYHLEFSNDKVKIKEKVELTDENFFFQEKENGRIAVNKDVNHSLVIEYAKELELMFNEYIEIKNNSHNLFLQMLQFGEVKNMMNIKPFVSDIHYMFIGNTLSDHIEIEYFFNHFQNRLIAYIESIPDMNKEERRVKKYVHICNSVDEIEELGNKYLEEFYK